MYHLVRKGLLELCPNLMEWWQQVAENYSPTLCDTDLNFGVCSLEATIIVCCDTKYPPPLYPLPNGALGQAHGYTCPLEVPDFYGQGHGG